MIPNNQEHFEAHQVDVDKTRRDFFSKQSPEIQAKITTIENAVKNLEELNVPFSLHINPFGHEFSDEPKKMFWWFGKLHKGEVGTKEANDSLKKSTDEYFSAVGSLAAKNLKNWFTAVTLYDKETMMPKFFFANGGLYSLELKKL